MSLKIQSLATESQKDTLVGLGYYGIGKYDIERLSKEVASDLIDELFEEQRLLRIIEEEDKHQWV